jgi:hypothetical protein
VANGSRRRGNAVSVNPSCTGFSRVAPAETACSAIASTSAMYTMMLTDKPPEARDLLANGGDAQRSDGAGNGSEQA